MQNKNIFDYCAGVKIKGDWMFKETCLVRGEVQQTTLQKTIRYYIAAEGCKILKINKTDGRQIQLESGKWMQREFSQWAEMPWEEYGIDESYYLDKIYREISNIRPPVDKQLQLF